eukprot:CAMPEP_0113910754 /NCGR_PEP_ID=MMETSP0780_2-20120614/27727_1 /TAXON_ID=652834 /ORGANISM="Palpitomonas bilix" /LENGTH=559 /DNA_ID=CAMNT_0000906997 /DNA_START=40 /DNA_END=1715 /DNA_ORIENTATION=- /assembly_acc=CAM_ASM_000599
MALEYQGPMMYKSGLGGWKDVYCCIQLSRHAPNAVLAVFEKSKASATPSGSVVGRVKSLYTLGAGFKVEQSSKNGKSSGSLVEHLEAKVIVFVSGKKNSFSVRIPIEERVEEWIQVLTDISDTFARGERYEKELPFSPVKGMPLPSAPPVMAEAIGAPMVAPPAMPYSPTPAHTDAYAVPVATPVHASPYCMPTAEAAIAAYPVDTPTAKAFTQRVDSRFFAYIRPNISGDLKEGWEKYHCIQQGGCIYAYNGEFEGESPLSVTAPEPAAAYLLFGTSLEYDEQKGCWKWSNGKHSAYFYPAEGGDIVLGSMIEETGVLAEEWVAGCLASAFGPPSLARMGMVYYNRIMFSYAKAAFDAWVERGGEQASVADKQVWERCLEDMGDAYMHFFSNMKEGELLFLFPKSDGAPPSIHRLRYSERTESEVKGGKIPLYFSHMYPHSSRKAEVVDMWRQMVKENFVGPIFLLTSARMNELKAKFPLKMNMYMRQHMAVLPKNSIFRAGWDGVEKMMTGGVNIKVSMAGGRVNFSAESKIDEEKERRKAEEMASQLNAERSIPVA